MIKTILKMGNPSLRLEASDLLKEDLQQEWFNQLKLDMIETLQISGGIGLAAPQIGVSKKLALLKIDQVNRYGEELSFPETFFINPRIEIIDPTPQAFWEGCLSVPGLRGLVERPRGIRVHYLNEHAQEKSIEAYGFLATVFQHELDHLFGVLYVDRLKSIKDLMYQDEFENNLQNQSQD